MPPTCSRVEALYQGAHAVLEDLRNALYTLEVGASNAEQEETVILAYTNSLRGVRDLVRGEIRRRQNG